jgi:hypothetical protein
MKPAQRRVFEMQSQDESLRHQIALGWAMNGVALVIGLAFTIIESSMMNNNFRAIRIDPGRHMKWLVYVIAMYPFMPMYIHLVHERKARIFRWLAFAAAVLGFFFFLLHHFSHWVAGQRLGPSSHAIDVVIELVSLWVIVNSFRWARWRHHES